MGDSVDLIKQSESFAKRCLEGNLSGSDKLDYFNLVISKFILLKEKIIKKRIISSNSIQLLFDIDYDYKYIDIIVEIVDYFKSKGEIEYSSRDREETIEVLLSTSEDSDMYIQKYIPDGLTIDELKKYIIDFHRIRNSLCHGNYSPDINNDCIKINNVARDGSFRIVGELPIKLLDRFSYIYYDKERQKYIEIAKKIINEISNSDSEEKKKELLSFLHEAIDFPDNYDRDVSRIIEEMISVINKDVDYSYKIAAVYNYLNIFFSFFDKNQIKRKPNIGRIKLSRINYFLWNDSTLKKSIEELVIKFINEFEGENGLLKKYLESQYNPESLLNLIIKKIHLYHNQLCEKIISWNVEILECIRNSVEHGNISPRIDGKMCCSNEQIELDGGLVTFYCESTPEDLFEIITSLDRDDVSFSDIFFTSFDPSVSLEEDDFMKEIKYIVGEKLFEKFVSTIENIKNTIRRDRIDFFIQDRGTL